MSNLAAEMTRYRTAFRLRPEPGRGWVAGVGRGCVAACLASAAVACGGGQTRAGAAFANDWLDDEGKAAAALMPHIEAVPIPTNADAVVAGVEDGLVGASLPDGHRWSFKHAVDSRPAVAGDVVVATGGGEIFALKATTGELLWNRPSSGSLRGIGDDGRTTVVSLARAGGQGSTLLAIERNGDVIRQVEAGPNVGVPAVRGDYAFFPWSAHYVTVFDLTSGREVARLFVGEPVSHAFTVGQSMYFGERRLVRFDARLAAGPKATPLLFEPLSRELPGQPLWLPSGLEPPSREADARDKVALFARPVFGARTGVDSDRFMARYFAYALGFDARTQAIAWVHTHGADLIAGSAFPGGAALCDSDGRVTLLDAVSGVETASIDLGQPLKSCVLETDALSVGRPNKAAVPLVDQLGQALADPRGDFVTLKEVLVDELPVIKEPKATRLLVDVLSDPRTPKQLFARAAKALVKRQNGAEFVLSALARHYDFLKGVLRSPPVGALADALTAMKERKGAPLLADHLVDPADSSADIRRVAAALLVLGDANQLPQLRMFFTLHRTGAEDTACAEALADVARALIQFGTGDDRKLVEDAVRDPYTVEAVRSLLDALIRETASVSKK